MLARWSRVFSRTPRGVLGFMKGPKPSLFQNYVAAMSMPSAVDSVDKGFVGNSIATVNLDKMFWSKPSSLALPKDSPLRVEEPNYEGIRRFILKLMLYYSKQSKAIRGANVVYKRISTQVDEPAIYNVFSLEKTFKTTFSLFVVHMWLCLQRFKKEGEEGVEFGQYLFEIYNHDLERRVSNAGVNLLLTRWMRDLVNIFYGNIVAYDKALLPEAGKDDLSNALWRNVFCAEAGSEPSDAAKHIVEAMARYIRREVACFSMTDVESMYSGNFMFTPLENPLMCQDLEDGSIQTSGSSL